MRSLRAGRAVDALRLGQDAIALLDRHGHLVPVDLLRQTAAAALTSGDGDAGGALLNRAAQLVRGADQQDVDPLDHARVIAEQARYLMTRGEPEQAEELLLQAHRLFRAAGSEREAAAVMGIIADIAYQRGDYDEALRIRREDELPVYERLGDTRATAICWGKIADITFQRGDYDEAAELQRRRLQVNEGLGDLDGIAAAKWGLAQIDLARKDYQSAFPRLVEAFQTLYRLQRAAGSAMVGRVLGEVLLARGAASPGPPGIRNELGCRHKDRRDRSGAANKPAVGPLLRRNRARIDVPTRTCHKQ
jgi:tetratricopeptide (TPR) repeat protein